MRPWVRLPVEPVAEPTMEPPVEPAEPPTSTVKRRRLKYLDFTAPPADPTFVDPEPEDSDNYDECEEEEMLQTDDEDDPCEDELPAVCGPRGDDDQDSPSGAAAAAATHETPKVVVQNLWNLFVCLFLQRMIPLLPLRLILKQNYQLGLRQFVLVVLFSTMFSANGIDLMMIAPLHFTPCCSSP